ncbi:MAG: oligosaccharide flippase family protein [Acidimicrobiales bacterium]
MSSGAGAGGSGSDEAGGQPAAGSSARASVLAGGAWSLWSWVVTSTTGLVLTVVLVRVMPSNSYGILATDFALVSVLSVLCSFGLSSSVAREASLAERPTAVAPAASRAAGIGMLAALLFVAIAALSMGIGGHMRQYLWPFVIMAPAVIVAPLANTSLGLASASFRYRLVAGTNIAGAVCALAFSGAVLLAGTRTAVPLAAVRTAAILAGYVPLVIGSRLLAGRRRVGAGDRAARAILTLGAAVVVSWAFAIMVANLDVVVLGLVRGSTLAGRYAPVSKLADAVAGLTLLLGGYVLPALTKTARNGSPAELHSLYRWATRWGLMMCLPPVLVLELVPAEVLHLLFGSKTNGLAAPARILGGGVLVNAALGYNGLFLIVQGARRVIVKISAFGIALTIVACGLLIPPYGAVGASLGTAVPLVLTNAAMSTYLWRQHRLRPLDRRTLALLVLAGAAAAGTVELCRLGGMGDWVTVVSTGVVTSIACLLVSLGIRGKADRRVLSEVFASRASRG